MIIIIIKKRITVIVWTAESRQARRLGESYSYAVSISYVNHNPGLPVSAQRSISEPQVVT